MGRGESAKTGVATPRQRSSPKVTVFASITRARATPVFADSPLPNYPDALLGVAAFEDREVVLDLGRGRLHVAPMMDLTIG